MVNGIGLYIGVLLDNGTNFVPVDRELRKFRWSSRDEITLKSEKLAIYEILGNADVTDGDLLTTFTSAEDR